MDEIERLLKTVFDIHYYNRPYVVPKALEIIEEYSNAEQNYNKYSEVLQKLRDLMDDLPQTILSYFLTTVPDPKLDVCTTPPPLIDLMKQMRLRQKESIKCELNDYISKAVPPLITIKQDDSKSTLGDQDHIAKVHCSPFRKGLNLDLERATLKIDDNACEKSCKRLLDICAEYIMSNIDSLTQFYETKNDIAWSKLNGNCYNFEDQKMCYSTIKDINKKRNWLRLIDLGYISGEELMDHYGKSEILLQGRCCMVNQINAQDKKQLMDTIHTFVTNPIKNK
ncbi:hypothetical protein RI129_002396 [Pyrocoelia pectoralis]|uniref:Uncharacterized protein n=1 Tax=Pyrocoelia pectoralis TaxID=417401 RepID=A0AAN7VNR5_9COLE